MTVADFFQQVHSSNDSSWPDAGSLAALFIVWQHSIANGLDNLRRPQAVPIRVAEDYGYQLVKIHAKPGGPVVDVVRDQYTQEHEMQSASAWLGRFAAIR